MTPMTERETNCERNKTSRGTQLVVALFLLATGIVPIAFTECFPFSAAPMFAGAFNELWIYRLVDANGKTLNNDRYGLRSNPNYYLETHYAVKYPENVVEPATREPDIERVRNHIRSVGVSQEAEFPLTLTITILGDLDGSRVGIHTQRQLVIEKGP